LRHFRQNRSEIPEKLFNVLLEKDREISWSDRVKNEGMHRVKEVKNILRTKEEGSLTDWTVTSCVETGS
jgi:hypothetical protein